MKQSLLILILSVSLSACSLGKSNTTPSSSSTPSVTPTPSATTIPMAAVVNGDGILQSEFEAELERYLAAQSASGDTSDRELAEQVVLDDIINQVLLAQGAAEEGYIVDDTALQERLDALSAQIGGDEALFAWQATNGYTDASFRTALRRQMTAAWMRDTIADAVPLVAEQVHVKQILLYNSEAANKVLAQLQSGADFDTLAATYDPVTQGELDWFPRGYLLHPVIEEAAFSLQPGEYSEVLQSDAGYHIIMVLARETEHTLSPDARLTLQMNALEVWLVEKRSQSILTITP